MQSLILVFHQNLQMKWPRTKIIPMPKVKMDTIAMQNSNSISVNPSLFFLLMCLPFLIFDYTTTAFAFSSTILM